MATASYLFDLARPAEADLPLAGWYGEPMTPAQAEALAREAQHGLRRRHAPGVAPLHCRLQWLVSGFWRGREVEAELENLVAVAGDVRTRALVQLIHGQLLASVRLRGALPRLDAGFAQAAHLLTPEPGCGSGHFLTVPAQSGAAAAGFLALTPHTGRPVVALDWSILR